MTKSSIVQARIEPKLKAETDAILSQIGMSASTAITLFYTQIVHHKGFPIDLKIPNEGVQEAMREARDPEFKKNAKKYTSGAALIADLDS